MQPLLAIAWLTLKSAVRFRLFQVLAVLLLGAVIEDQKCRGGNCHQEKGGDDAKSKCPPFFTCGGHDLPGNILVLFHRVHLVDWFIDNRLTKRLCCLPCGCLSRKVTQRIY